MNAVSPTFELPSSAFALSVTDFAVVVGVSDRAARNAFNNGSFRGYHLPVVQVPGRRGEASGTVWALHLDKASPDLRARLKLPETLPSMPVKRRLNARPNDRHVTTAADKQRIIAAILAHPKGSHERAAAIEDAALQPHKIGNGWQRFSERTLRDWVQSAESGVVAALMPVARSDKGKRRVCITRRWQDGCGLPEAVQEGIAAQLEGIARGLILKGRSARETQRLASIELQRLSVAAGVRLPKAQLAHLCTLTGAWVIPFAEMTVARDYLSDHKRFSDDHEARVHRELTRFPMEVLMRVASFRPLMSRVTANVHLPRPDKKELAALAVALFPGQPDLIRELEDLGAITGNMRSLGVAARQSKLAAKGEAVTLDLLRRIVRMMGGKRCKRSSFTWT